MNAEQLSTEIIDGMVIDIETGEILGLAQPPAFQVNSPESLDWVMEKMQLEEAKIHEIDNTAIVVQARAILENAAKMKAARSKRLEWLHARFDTEIGEYVAPSLAGRSTRTWKTLFGSVSFRTKPGGLRVASDEMALAWASINYPDAIKTTAVFQISRLPSEQVILLTGKLLLGSEPVDSALREAFAVIPDSETLSVKTPVTP